MLYLYQRKKIIRVEVIVIGGGPTGLAAGYYLGKENIRYIVLEKNSFIVPSWYNLWDNFQLAMPSDKIDMPGVNLNTYFGASIHPTAIQMIKFFNDYVKNNALEVQLNCAVHFIEKIKDQIVVHTHDKIYICSDVIFCLGPRQLPHFPPAARDLINGSHLKVMHSSEYRSTKKFKKDDRILVVGSGLSALCIAQDIHQGQFKVDLSCGYSSKEIMKRNQHVYQQPCILPTLHTLKCQGIINYGRFIGFNSHTQTLHFHEGHNESKVSINSYNIIIFATGYKSSLDSIKQIILNKDSFNMQNEIHFVGMRPTNHQTVTISEGSAQAKNVVNTIVNRMRGHENLSKTESYPRYAKL